MCAASLIRTVTVGIGFSPIRQLKPLLADLPFGLTAGRDLHPAPKQSYFITIFTPLQELFYSFAALLTFPSVRLSLVKSTVPSGKTELDSTVSQPE